MESSTRQRADRYGYSRLIRSWDFKAAFLASVVFVPISAVIFTYQGRSTFIESGTTTAQTLTTVILTGVIILVSISDDDFFIELIKERNFETIMFSFEYTVGLAIITSVTGVIVQSYTFGLISYSVFTFLFFYTVFASLAIVSKIITFGHKKAQKIAVEEIDDEIRESGTIIGPDGKERESIGGEVVDDSEKDR